jgi:DNA-binding IclR family transcriptional regulator
VRCIAAGIYDDSGKLVAGLSLSAPADRLQDAWLANLNETALAISTSLGFHAPHPDTSGVAAPHTAAAE